MPNAAEPRNRRPSRWDRPKEQHDRRWVLGVVGKVLVSLGLLLFAFVVYQLWGTGIQTAREQSRLRHEFEQQLEGTSTTSVAPSSVPPATDGTTTAAPSTAAPSTASPSTMESAPASTEAPTTVPAPVVTAPEPGGPVAQLDIPVMDLHDKIVVEGVSPSNLQDGPGHFPETPLPGQLGNAAIAGHRTTHGQPFRHIDRLKPGDDITVTTLAGTYVYVVTGQRIVSPDDYADVIPTVDPTKATLTLTSCHPVHSSKQRIVVFAELDPTRSSPLTQGEAGLGTQSPSALPGDETSTDAGPATTEPATTEPATTTPATTPATTAPSTTTPAVVSTEPAGSSTTEVAEAPADSTEAFGNDWFSDPDAVPQVLLWGLVLAAVWIGIFLLSRRARSYVVGVAVGALPFVVVLYFFFENVNRLLPPNL